ncbi:MAG: hypothetical protein HW387_1036 [Parachlamydiales bacterium]|nr:hypothetical protein [Parachlamydiales bacterium]
MNKERYCWGSGQDLANLICKSMIDADGTVISSVRYLYDARGNVTEERLYGNLSGVGPAPVLGANGIPIDNGTEVYCKRFRYTSSAPNLLLEESDDSGRRIVTDYLPGTDLPVSQLTYDRDVLKARKTFEYDNDRVLIREVTDDGVSQTIRRITPIAQAPYIGLPHIIEESYAQDGREQLLKKTVLTYTTGAKMVRQDVYDAQNALRFSIEMAYDGKGRLIERTNPAGQRETSSYDPCGNRILTHDFSGRLTHTSSYDACHRPTLIQHQGDDGIIQNRRLGYDLLSNLASDIDCRGHETKNIYDAMNRRIETRLPQRVGEKKELISPVCHSSYDGAGREILHTDAMSYTTKTSYNAYGKPILVIHPDGGRDEYTYNLDGILKTHIDPQGTSTSFVYNALRQITQKTISSGEGILAEEYFEYSGNNLIAQIDAEGNRTTYTYDGAGRKIAEECNGEKTAFSHDSLGRLHQTQTGDLCSVTEHNLRGQVVEEKKMSASGDLIRHVQYEYDAAGNRSAIIRFVAGQKAQETMKYDSMNRLIQKTDAIGHTETTAWQDQYSNAYGQRVLQTIHTDPMGLETIETKDTHDHLAAYEKRNGCTLSRQEKFYDADGRPVQQIDTVFTPDGSSHDVQTHWEYDTRGRLTLLTEADGTLDAKTTRHLYQQDGKLSQTIKPDGTSLFYAYDGLSNLVSLHSSDGTLSHQMAYNRLSQLVQSDNILRTYDAKGRILSETFPGGYSLENTYDLQGRRISCSIPAANCRIEHSYHGLDPQNVQRKTFDGQALYTHHYSSYDLSGNLLEEELIDNSRVRLTIDPLSRKTRIDSPHFIQEAVQFDSAGNITRMDTQNDKSVYLYDKLYQLTSESGLFAHEYANDSLYNRRQKDQERIQVNDLNEDVSHFEYDRNGNPIRQNDTRYTYDALDRLIRIESPQQRQDFTYDSLHRCLTKTSVQNGVSETRYFLYDGQNEIGTFDERAQLQELRVLGSTPHAEIGAAIAIELQGKAYAPIHDLPGNIAALAPLDHGAAAIYRYSAFGEEKIDGSILSPWRYSSKRSDASTGLVYYGRRYYMPMLGRWLTPDPAGFTDGMNLYAFVHNDPLTHFDEYGLWLEPRPPGTFNSSQGYQLMANSCVDLYSNPRVWGGAQALGGLVATNIGIGITGTVILAPFGLPLTAYGLDHYIAGMNTVFSGVPRDTFTTQLLHKTGMSLDTARLTDCGLGIGLTGVGGAMRVAANQGSQVAAFTAFQRPVTASTAQEANLFASKGLTIVQQKSLFISASKAYDQNLTQLAHSFSKHAGRYPEIWGKINGPMDSWHGQALNQLNDICNAPGSFAKIIDPKTGLTWIEKRLPSGSGVRLNQDYTFKGFVD